MVIEFSQGDEHLTQTITILGINPEPWDLGTISTGRRKTGEGFQASMSPNAKLVAYQQALREWFENRTDWEKIAANVPIALTFYFIREIERYESPIKKQVSFGHVADATNLQKATEDALQGILFENDRAVRSIRTEIVGQEVGLEPVIIIRMQAYQPRAGTLLLVTDLFCNERARLNKKADNSW